MTQTASDAGQHVAGVAKDQAAEVAGATKREAKDLLRQSRSQAYDQTSQQQQKVAQGVRSLSEELRGMADQADSGTASDLVHEVSRRAGDVAQWLEREPSEVLQDVKTFARQRPGTFLAIALGAGLLAGRVGRGLQAEHSDQASTPSPTTPTTAPVATDPLHDPLHDPLYDPLDPIADPSLPAPGSPGVSGPGAGAASAPRQGLSGTYDDPLR